MDCQEYIKKHLFSPMRNVRVWNGKTMTYKPIFQVEMCDVMDYHLMFPIGMEDINKKEIYQGDILEITLSSAWGDMELEGVVRTEGFYCTGIDLLKNGEVDMDDGIFIDELFINKREVIGNIFEGKV